MPRVLLVIHALVAFALAGASTHLALVMVGFLRGSRQRLRLARLYAQTAGALVLATVALGAVLYPAFKVRVVFPYLAKAAPWATVLFDVKEAVALTAGALGVFAIVLGRRFDGSDRAVNAALATCAFLLFALVSFCVVAGLVIVAERGL